MILSVVSGVTTMPNNEAVGRREPEASCILRRMRKPMALSCCVLYLAFSSIAGSAHVHRAADHHDELRGLHLDHGHIGHATEDDPGRHHHPRSSEPGEARTKGLHIEQHDGDALELRVTAQRPSAPGLRVMPATVVMSARVEAPSFVRCRSTESSDPLRGPPCRSPVPARAPPA